MKYKEIHNDIMKYTKLIIKDLKEDPFSEIRYYWSGFKSFMVSLFALVVAVALLLFFPITYIIAFAIRGLKK